MSRRQPSSSAWSAHLRSTLRDRGQVTDVFGPIDGFRMRLLAARYEEPSAQNMPPRRDATAVRVLADCRRGGDFHGASVAAQFSPDARQLRERRAARPTVAAWVYPDSYPELRSLKKSLWDAGIPLTVQPRREGEFIGMAVGEGFKPMAE